MKAIRTLATKFGKFFNSPSGHVLKLALLFAAVTMLMSASAVAQAGGAGSGLDKSAFFADNVVQGDTQVAKGLGQLVQWVYWIFYLLGAVIMGTGAFKLKQGDVAGFGKNMAGGATLFFVPSAIKVFRSIGQNAWGN